MLERKIEKIPQLFRYLAVESTDYRAGCDSARQCVCGKRPGITAKHVARKLIQHNEQCQCTFSGLFPAREVSDSGCLVGGKKTLPDFVVECRVLFEPAVWTCLLPERHDVGCTCDHCASYQLAAGCAGSSRKARRRILPTFVFGNSSRNSICFGTL